MSEFEVKFIPCKSIEVSTVESWVRSFSKEFAVKLADSIKVDGLLIPIAVRPNPDKPGRFILVNGKHRLHAVKKVLKQELIEARVFNDMTAGEAEIARDVEQLWQNPLTPAQHAAAIKRWHNHWLAKLRPIQETAASMARGSAEPETSAKATFDQLVADATGQSVEAVRRTKTLAKSFNDEDLEALAQCDVSQADMLTIARIKDQAKRSMVVKLIASGRTVEAAVKDVCGDAAPDRRNKTRDTKKEQTHKAEAKADKEPEIDDETWFERHCGRLARALANPQRFKADAILFRHMYESRHTFRRNNKAMLGAIKRIGLTGTFWNLMNRAVTVTHPKDWGICPACKGTGRPKGTREGQQDSTSCNRCFGGGYCLKTEKFV